MQNFQADGILRQWQYGTMPIMVIVLMLTLTQCNQRTDYSDPAKEGIPVSNASEVGMDSAVLNKMIKSIREGEYGNIHSILVSRHGKLVAEGYFKGPDEYWGQSIGNVSFDENTLHDVRSISKSVVSACVGIAIDKGLLTSTDQRVMEFFPEFNEYDSGTMATLTVRHLLTMTSGLAWNEDVPYDDPANSEVLMINSDDPIKFVLSQPFDTIPGTLWKYNGGTTQLLAAIIDKVSGIPVDEFADVHLFKPLGIEKFEWVAYPGNAGPAAASGLRLRPRDLLKFGLLYYNGGVWNNNRILREDWVDQSLATQVPRGEKDGYGYQFWIWDSPFKDKNVRIAACVGNGDQRIFFNKEADLVVVTTAGNYNRWNLPKGPNNLLQDFVYPSIH